MNSIIKTLLGCGLMVVTLSAIAQPKPLLEREVSITFSNEKLDVALEKLSRQEKFTFSYNPTILNVNATVKASYKGKTLREVIAGLVGPTVQMKERGNYIILTKAPITQPKTSSIAPLIINGYVLNGASGDKLGEVSVYDKKTLSAAVTNSYGFFSLKIENPDTANFISVSKRDFYDTIFSVSPTSNRFLNVVLLPEMAQESEPLDEKIKLDSIVVPDRLPDQVENQQEIKSAHRSHIENIKDTLYRPFQVSFLPFIGTNHILSGNVINDYSFNIIGGYGLGVRALEIGGYFNINRGDVGHIQLAGVFNFNGGSMNGFQGAGVFNFNLHSANAVQAAGVFNVNGRDSKGAQLAGVVNAQLGSYEGTQIAGVVNVVTDKITGSQISGLINYGRYVRGVQIGFLNIADSMKGVPIGFLSFVKHGYHKIEVSADEVFPANLAFRTGVPLFYNIFTAGMKQDNFWTIGYGVGTAPKVNKWLSLNFDLTGNHISNGVFTESINSLTKLYVGFDVQPLRKLSFTVGATLNGYVTETTNTDFNNFFNWYQPRLIYNKTFTNDINLKMWWGVKVGVRFL